jgi:hypothetical protein
MPCTSKTLLTSTDLNGRGVADARRVRSYGDGTKALRSQIA